MAHGFGIGNAYTKGKGTKAGLYEESVYRTGGRGKYNLNSKSFKL